MYAIRSYYANNRKYYEKNGFFHPCKGSHSSNAINFMDTKVYPMKLNIDLLNKICTTPGAPGFEQRIREVVLKESYNFV